MVKKGETAAALREEFTQKLAANYNCGWARGIYKVTDEKGRWDKTAIICRDIKVTYRQMFDRAFQYARSLKALGFGKRSLIPLCVGHCPETIYTLLGASLIGAGVTPFGKHFDPEYIVERLSRMGSTVLIVTDDKYEALKSILPGTGISRVVMFSIKDSYVQENALRRELEEGFYDGINRVPIYQAENDRIIDVSEFLKLGEDYCKAQGFEEEPGSLEDIFSITYSSGTTNSHRPKPIVHQVKTYLGTGYIRTLETPDLNKFSKTGEIRSLVHIPLYSNTSLLASISDALFLGSTLCLEHIYDERFFPRSLLLNKPNQVIATTSHWISGMRTWMSEPIYQSADLRDLMSAFTAGEPASLGEERFINRCFKHFHAAADFPAFKFINALGMGGGDCENCGLWRLPHKATFEKLKRLRHFTKKGVEKGYETYTVVDWAILDRTGKHCGPNEHGLLVIDSPFTMLEYDGMPEATADTRVRDADGREWTSCRIWAYYDEFGEVFLKGRYSADDGLPLYVIDDEILKDADNVMSCKTVALDDGTLVAHIALQSECTADVKAFLSDLEKRLSRAIPADVLGRLVYKIRPEQYSYPLTGSGKRDGGALKEERAADTWKPVRDHASQR